jgi:hypothetical protein
MVHGFRGSGCGSGGSWVARTSRSELLHRRISIPAADHGGSELLGSRVHESPRRVTHSRIHRIPSLPISQSPPYLTLPVSLSLPPQSLDLPLMLTLSFSQSLFVSVLGDKKNRRGRKKEEERTKRRKKMMRKRKRRK